MINLEDVEPISVKVDEFCKKCNLELLCGDSNSEISFSSVLINRPGLLLAGFKDYFVDSRVQLIGNAEKYYLEALSDEDHKKAVDTLVQRKCPCIIFSRGIKPSKFFIEAAAKYNVPLMGTAYTTTYLSNSVANYLEELLAPMQTIHGTLMDVDGVGVMISGASGMGKSEAALELIQRGHRIISDDVVIVKRIMDKVYGTAPEKTKFLMEIRGLGIIDVAAMFGSGSVLNEEEIMLIVELQDCKDILDCDRLGSKVENEVLLDVPVPKYKVPVMAGRNISILIEVAVRNFRLQKMGQNALQKLIERAGLQG